MPVDRRTFLKTVSLAAASAATSLAPQPVAAALRFVCLTPEPGNYDDHIKDYLHKMQHFNEHFAEDMVLTGADMLNLRTTVARLNRLQRTVGFGNFYILDFEDGLRIAEHTPAVGAFTKREIAFLEMIFHEDAARYGFFGGKPLSDITDRIREQDVVKVPGTGNFLYKGKPHETYRKIISDVGNDVILTSGVRSVMKQFLLFLNKTLASDGNLSLASRSLAPPGYSYHGISDFDVGQIGFGTDNFTEKFTTTEVFWKLENLGYVDLRYPKGNLLGVRFEPWHIKVRQSS
ncbi:MAG: M15 family metallopeptidase [Desulfovibrionaceae bacterium]